MEGSKEMKKKAQSSDRAEGVVWPRLEKEICGRFKTSGVWGSKRASKKAQGRQGPKTTPDRKKKGARA